jgi:perosamine synthetase
MQDPIPQMAPWFGEEEKEAICAYLEAGGWITEFKQTQRFEQMIAEYTGAKHAVVVNNGTVSLVVAALACDVGPGDEVIVPDYTMIATPNAVRLLGATPVFVDVERETLCLDLAKTAEAITDKTRAIMLVSANGRYPGSGVEAFEALARERGVALIEDAAQALGSFYPDGRHIGRAGVVGSFSFSAPKVISTGQGGALITDDEAAADRLRKLKDFGRSGGGGTDVHETFGINLKFTDIQACVGIEQMKKLPWRVERKKAIYRLYQAGLRDVPQVRFFEQDLERTSPWFIDTLVENRAGLQAHLREQKIGSRVMYPPINRQPVYDLPGEFPVAELVGEEGLWLPSASQLSDADVDRICAAITGFYGERSSR